MTELGFGLSTFPSSGHLAVLTSLSSKVYSIVLFLFHLNELFRSFLAEKSNLGVI